MAINPIKYRLPSGEIVILFPIGTLAKAMGKTTDAIKLLERRNLLPKTPFKSKWGVRLYTQGQIDIIVKYARKHGFTGSNSGIIYNKKFVESVKTQHTALLIKYGILKGG